VIMLHGGSLDRLALDFPALARQWYESRKALGWYTMVCNHNGAHTIPPNFGRHAYRFFLDHPFKTAPEPYGGGIPNEFPDYCGNEFR
jgi:L-amino acid N-acyltransferase YncA